MIKKFLKILIISLFFSNPGYSAGSSGSSDTKVKPKANTPLYSATVRIKKAKKLEKKGKIEKSKKLYKEALKYLYKANKENPADPDTLNYLGFANRKIDNIKGVFIGDSKFDFLCAQNAQWPCILFSQGYSDVDIKALDCYQIFNDYKNLPNIIEKVYQDFYCDV